MKKLEFKEVNKYVGKPVWDNYNEKWNIIKGSQVYKDKQYIYLESEMDGYSDNFRPITWDEDYYIHELFVLEELKWESICDYTGTPIYDTANDTWHLLFGYEQYVKYKSLLIHPYDITTYIPFEKGRYKVLANCKPTL